VLPSFPQRARKEMSEEIGRMQKAAETEFAARNGVNPLAEIRPEEKYRPAPLSVLDAMKGLAKYGHHRPIVPELFWQAAALYFRRLSAYILPSKVRTKEEVILYSPDTSKSPGYHPTVRLRELFKTKKDWILKFGDMVYKFIREGWTEEEFQYFTCVFGSFMKEELRLAIKKTRQINNCPVFRYCLGNMLFQDLHEQLYAANVAESGSHFGPGVSPMYGHWDRLFLRLINGMTPEQLAKLGFVCADVVHEDSTLFAEFSEYYDRWRFSNLEDPDAVDPDVKELMIFFNKHPFVALNGNIYILWHGNVSGREDTVILNTCFSGTLVIYVYLLFGREPETNFATLGDDVIAASLWLRMSHFHEAGKMLALTFTGGDETMDSAHFLSGLFKKTRGVRIYCNYNVAKFEKSIAFVKRNAGVELTWYHLCGVRMAFYGNKALFKIVDDVCKQYLDKYRNVLRGKLSAYMSETCLRFLYTGLESGTSDLSSGQISRLREGIKGFYFPGHRQLKNLSEYERLAY